MSDTELMNKFFANYLGASTSRLKSTIVEAQQPIIPPPSALKPIILVSYSTKSAMMDYLGGAARYHIGHDTNEWFWTTNGQWDYLSSFNSSTISYYDGIFAELGFAPLRQRGPEKYDYNEVNWVIDAGAEDVLKALLAKAIDQLSIA